MTAGGSSIREVQRLLQVLAAGRRAAEVGTAFGEGAAAIASTASSLVTVESDPQRAEVARRRLSDLANVTLLVGDWHEALPPLSPFELLFFDGGGWKHGNVEGESRAALELVSPGGLVVIDDMTPGWEGHDPARDFWLGSEGIAASEILTTPETAAIVAAKLR